jgi:hypothetical protein
MFDFTKRFEDSALHQTDCKTPQATPFFKSNDTGYRAKESWAKKALHGSCFDFGGTMALELSDIDAGAD